MGGGAAPDFPRTMPVTDAKVLGAEKVLNIKKRYQPIEVHNGDAFLICSDGFWEYVCETEMEADLLKSDSAEVWLKYMLKRHLGHHSKPIFNVRSVGHYRNKRAALRK